MVWHKQRRGSFVLEAAVVLLLLMAAAGSIAHFASATKRARQQQWTQFQRETQLENVAERLQHVPPTQQQSIADRLMEDDRYGRPRIELRPVEVNGIAGQHIVITSRPDGSSSRTKQVEFWQFDAAETDPDDSGADEEGDNDDA